MASIISQQGNANKNHSEVRLRIHSAGWKEKYRPRGVLAEMRRNQPGTLLVGRQDSAKAAWKTVLPFRTELNVTLVIPFLTVPLLNNMSTQKHVCTCAWPPYL